MKKKFANANIIGLKNTTMVVFYICILFYGIGTILYNNSSEALSQSISQSLENRVIDNSRMLTEILKEKLTATKLIAEDSNIRSMDWNKQKSELLSHINTLDMKRCRIIDKNGISKSTDGYVTDLSDREYFKNAINGTSNVSDVIKSKSDGSLLIICATPIKDLNNNILGVLTYGINYQILRDFILSIRVSENGYAILVNDKGTIIAHPQIVDNIPSINILEKTKNKSDSIEFIKLKQRMINGETGTGFFKTDNSNNFMAFTPVNGTNWFIGLVVPENEIFSTLNSLKTKFILGTLLFIILAFLMLYLTLAHLSQRKKVEDLQRDVDKNYRQMIEIAELDKLKTEFFSNLSHELRTPLNVILSTLQLFEHYINEGYDKNKTKITKHTIAMKQNCFRLLRLINNLLDITRIDSGFFELRLQSIDIVNFIKELTISVYEYARNNGLELRFNSQVKKKYINCDVEKLERIMLNLLSNSIKFTPNGGKIYVNVSVSEDHIIISIKDTGIGIPEDKLNLIFERFRQVEQSLTRSYEGSGIGLSIVKSLVEMHKGKISVKSKIGIGSEFTFEIPNNLQIHNKLVEQVERSYINDGNYIEKVKIELSELNHK